MNQDFVDLLRIFVAHDVRFLVVGAYALALHGRPRATGDLDVWVDASPENAPRVMQALASFGAPLAQISEADFSRPGVVYQLGVAPGRIDLLTELTGLTFDEAWPGRVRQPFGDVRWTSSVARRSSATSARPDAPRTSATSRTWSTHSRLADFDSGPTRGQQKASARR